MINNDKLKHTCYDQLKLSSTKSMRTVQWIFPLSV